jgi:Amidohydrolase
LGKRPLWFLIWGGVLERHPDLRVVFTEQGSSWIPRLLQLMDWQWENDMGGMHQLIPRRPSEYWTRQGMLGASLFSFAEAELRNEIGLNQMMWGNDFPHFPCNSLGKLPRYLARTLGASGMPQSEAEAIVGGNAVRFYNLDVDKLSTIAERVGPTVDDVLSESDGEDDQEVAVAGERSEELFRPGPTRRQVQGEASG